MRPCKYAFYEGKGQWIYGEDGMFHQWATAYQEFEAGPGNYTVALVELPDGTIKEILPSKIQFMDKEKIDNE